MAAISEGKLTPQEGRTLSRILGEHANALHTLELQRRVAKYPGICIEDLNVAALAKTKLRGHGKSVLDAAFGECRRQIAYKTTWNRRHLAVIDRWYPSSKTCHVCGAVNAALTLAKRSWTCICGAHLDRDLNASFNIKAEGLKLLAAGCAESLTAHGANVRLPQAEAVGVEL